MRTPSKRFKHPVQVILADSAKGSQGLATALDARDDIDLLARTTVDGLFSKIGVLRTHSQLTVLVASSRGDHEASSTIRSLRARYPVVRVIAFGPMDNEIIERALLAGADGFVDARLGPDRFIEAVQLVLRREEVVVGRRRGDPGAHGRVPAEPAGRPIRAKRTTGPKRSEAEHVIAWGDPSPAGNVLRGMPKEAWDAIWGGSAPPDPGPTNTPNRSASGSRRTPTLGPLIRRGRAGRLEPGT